MRASVHASAAGGVRQLTRAARAKLDRLVHAHHDAQLPLARLERATTQQQTRVEHEHANGLGLVGCGRVLQHEFALSAHANVNREFCTAPLARPPPPLPYKARAQRACVYVLRVAFLLDKRRERLKELGHQLLQKKKPKKSKDQQRKTIVQKRRKQETTTFF